MAVKEVAPGIEYRGNKLFVGDIHVPREVLKIITLHLKQAKHQLDSPYYYRMTATNMRGGYRVAAEHFCGVINKWASKHYAEVKLLANYYDKSRTAINNQLGYVALKITDPVAFAIERIHKHRHLFL